jgi:hypothetical protein
MGKILQILFLILTIIILFTSCATENKKKYIPSVIVGYTCIEGYKYYVVSTHGLERLAMAYNYKTKSVQLCTVEDITQK